MEGSWSVITVDPWQGESLLIKPLASFYTRTERERNHKKGRNLSTPPAPPHRSLFHLNLLNIPGGRRAQTQTPLVACGLLTSWLPFGWHCSFTSQLLPNVAMRLLIAGTLQSRTTKAKGQLALASASLWSSSVPYARSTRVYCVKNHTDIDGSHAHSHACRVFSLGRSILKIVRTEAK